MYYGGKWGVFGISCCSDFMNKDLVFNRYFVIGVFLFFFVILFFFIVDKLSLLVV